MGKLLVEIKNLETLLRQINDEKLVADEVTDNSDTAEPKQANADTFKLWADELVKIVNTIKQIEKNDTKKVTGAISTALNALPKNYFLYSQLDYQPGSERDRFTSKLTACCDALSSPESSELKQMLKPLLSEAIKKEKNALEIQVKDLLKASNAYKTHLERAAKSNSPDEDLRQRKFDIMNDLVNIKVNDGDAAQTLQALRAFDENLIKNQNELKKRRTTYCSKFLAFVEALLGRVPRIGPVLAGFWKPAGDQYSQRANSILHPAAPRPSSGKVKA